MSTSWLFRVSRETLRQRCQPCPERRTPTSSPSCGSKSTLQAWFSRSSRSVLFVLHSCWHVANQRLFAPNSFTVSEASSTSFVSASKSHLVSVHANPDSFHSRSLAPSHRLQCARSVSPRSVSPKDSQRFATASVLPPRRSRLHGIILRDFRLDCKRTQGTQFQFFMGPSFNASDLVSPD